MQPSNSFVLCICCVGNWIGLASLIGVILDLFNLFDLNSESDADV